MPLTLEDLEFSQLSFEIRFAHSYLVWDRAGLIWQEVSRLFPDAIVVNAQPNNVAMREGAFELTWEPNRAGIQLFDSRELKRAPRLFAEFGQAIVSALQLRDLKRVGLRMIHGKTFPDKKAAAAAMLGCGLLSIPAGKHFGVSGEPLFPELSFRKEEGSKGYSVRLKAESLDYKLDLPYVWHKIAKSISETREQVTFDVDCYVEGTILLSQLSFEEWLTQTMHVIRRDYSPFLGA